MNQIEQYESGLKEVEESPRDTGVLEMIVRRPATDQRQVLEVAELNVEEGLAGDSWKLRRSSHTPDGSAHPDMQLTLMNVRLIEMLAGAKERWSLAGDQLYVDLDLSKENLPPGTQLRIGTAVIETTNMPHTGCKKFSGRFGVEALKFISAPERRHMQLRGIYARVVQPGVIRTGDLIQKLHI